MMMGSICAPEKISSIGASPSVSEYTWHWLWPGHHPITAERPPGSATAERTALRSIDATVGSDHGDAAGDVVTGSPTASYGSSNATIHLPARDQSAFFGPQANALNRISP
jgi:hypothetical protein